ncbi:tyrosine-protein kinase-like [Dysidea avara]|uniref:tyrosine-protein kinase-like n=1 Tax=Dysidea avara TaxID=196820 RepID=UPI00331A4D71
MSTDDPDWWLAKCKDSTRVGYVPSNYISENMLHQPNSKSDSSNKWSYSHHPVFIAKYSYSPRKKNELGFKEGDLFYIMNTDDPNWWLGKNKDLSGQVGYIPSNYIVKFGGNQIRVPQNQLKVADAEERKNPDSELIAYPPCVAKYSYSPRRESELGFNKGEKLYVINTDDANWWLAGQMGCIPSSYVSEFRTDQLQNESKANDSDRETNRKLEAVKACNLNYPLFIAKSNYSPRRDNELGFKEGDLMYVVNSEDCNWWIAGRVGYIPSNYVSLIDSNNSDRSFFGTNIDSSNYPLFIAKYNYTARTDFDLSFKKGDLLHIVRVDDDGWWLARRSNSQEGCIPSSYVKEYKSLLDAEDWYFGAISFKHAEEVLMQAPNDHGSFLICDCKKASSGFTLVVRVKSTIKRWRIDKSSNKKYFIHPDTAFESLQQLVEYYTEHTGEFSFEIIKTPCVPTEVYRTAGLSKATNKAWQIQRNSLKLCKKIDTGNFGEMWEAVWNNGTPVIVNTLNPGTITVSDFLKEATVMKQLRHRNVVQLYAVCVEEEPIYVVTELMEHGNLQDYLRGDGRALQLPQLINMGAQVAAGMAYLENNTYIHGNVTARSVFVSEHLICRIGDFGVINALAKDPSIKLTNTTPATKWAAPEVLLSSIFTVKSDVWSFGIFLHELVTYGQLPYHDKKDENLIEELKRGYRIPRPTNCPEQLHKIMIKCWNEDANSRPTFETLQWQLEEFFIDDVLYAVTTSTPYLPQ